MTEAEAAKRIDSLRRDIIEHNRRYYEEAAPTISDREYDRLYKELLDLETKFPDLVTPDSPTNASAVNRCRPSRKFSIACQCSASTTLIPRKRSPTSTNESRVSCRRKKFRSWSNPR